MFSVSINYLLLAVAHLFIGVLIFLNDSCEPFIYLRYDLLFFVFVTNVILV